MIRWIQSKAFLPECALAFFLLLFGAVPDFIFQGPTALIPASFFVVSVLFLRRFEYVSLIATGLAVGAEMYFGLQPAIAGILTIVAVFFASAFSKPLWAMLYAGVRALAGIAVSAYASFNSLVMQNLFGVSIYSQSGRWTVFIITVFANLIVIFLAWIAGNWLIVQHKERILERERSAIDEKQIRLAIDIAEQNERMGIARDLNLVTTQQLSASIALIEGARYASKLNPEIATRTLERVEGLLRETQTELQQQQDALSHGVSIAPAPPNIFDLDALMIQYREAGYNCTLKHLGQQKSLIDSAELAIYRIVFDALGNVRKHAPVGTDITVDLTWQDGGLQLLIKDNGTETARKQSQIETSGEYNVNDDLQALVAEVDGVGIRTMRERAEIIGGSLEAKVVPGVGFTVNALFPNLKSIQKN